MRIITTTTGVAITLDGDLLAVMEVAVPGSDGQPRLERSFEDMVKEIHHLIDQMDDGERRTYLRREPVSQHREVRERQARGSVYAETDEEMRGDRRKGARVLLMVPGAVLSAMVLAPC